VRLRGSFVREIGKTWAGRSIHEITKRDVVEVITAIEQRGAPVSANKALKATKNVFCAGAWVEPCSIDPPPKAVPLPSKGGGPRPSAGRQ